MPVLARTILVVAAPSGLILQPGSASARPAVKVDYKTNLFTAADPLTLSGSDSRPSLEVQGLIGLLTISSSSFLFAILRKKRVAQLWSFPVYTVSDIVVIPLSSQADAQSSIQLAREALAGDEEQAYDQKQEPHTDADDDAVIGLDDTWLDAHIARLGPRTAVDHKRRPSIAQDVIGKKGAYGRFATKWFSTEGWLHGSRRTMGMSGSSNLTGVSSTSAPPSRSVLSTCEKPAAESNIIIDSHDERSEHQESYANCLPANFVPKLLHTTKLILSSGTFFFSYDIDLTHRLGSSPPTSSNLDMHKQVDPSYFWNGNLLEPFITHGLHDLALPLLQGFVGQREFNIASDPKSDHLSSGETATAQDIVSQDGESAVPSVLQSTRLLLTLISRRSARRSGLRYLRRGVDEDGNVANAVETEQILSCSDWSAEYPVQSFVQFRGSIPLFFTQLPYSFKPPAVLHGSSEANKKAFKAHFDDLHERFGAVQAISLVDRQGVETTIGEAYEKRVADYNAGSPDNTKIGFEWFNFHKVCRGMKFENVSLLVNQMRQYLAEHAWTTATGNNSKASPSSIQSGIIRTNCMDCLDRTNVVQSAMAQFILERQLANLGYEINLVDDPKTTWFNTLWADNGDAVSRSYAGTAALKGDYTRTRRRNMYGMLTDFSLTLTRYYHNLFNDFFAQAVIDYLLGNVTEQVFPEFETKMISVDPAIDLQKARDGAIQLATSTITSEHEDLISGWTVAMPVDPSSLQTLPLLDSLLLLTDKAVYSVRYDWDAEKVKSFERIPLQTIQALQLGVYITETLNESQTNPDKNYGCLIQYKTESGRPGLVRVNTRTVVTAATGLVDPGTGHAESASTAKEGPPRLAFKALPQGSKVVRSASSAIHISEKQLVQQIGEQILKAARELMPSSHTSSELSELDNKISICEVPIVSLADARRGASVVDYVSYSLKKLVWG